MKHLSKYSRIMRVSLTERLAYRSDFFLATFLRFLPMLTTILLWTAVFAGSDQTELAGFRLNEMIAYLLLVHISRMFSSMPGLAQGVARDIRDGTLKKYLVQPLDMIGYLLAYRVAHKTAYIATTAIPYAMLFALCHQYFDVIPDLPTFTAYALALVLAFVIGFHLEVCIGMIGFWMLEVSSLLYVINTVNYFISGHMFPIDLLPPPWPDVLKMLPTQYLAYFPAVVFLGKVQGWELVRGLSVGAGWAFVLSLSARGLYGVGLRRYSAYGG